MSAFKKMPTEAEEKFVKGATRPTQVQEELPWENPALKPSLERTNSVSFVCTLEINLKLEWLAKQKEISKSKVLRALLDKTLDKEIQKELSGK